MENNFEKESAWILEEKYNGVTSDAYNKDIQKLHEGVPVAYIIGNAPFLGCTIDLSYQPLIPRTETEFWVEQTIKNIKETRCDKPLHILDLFAGSGCIGISLLKHIPQCTVDFGEHDKNLLEQIRKNIEINSIDLARTQIYETNCFNHIPSNSKYDYILANPPYIAKYREAHIQPSVLNFEPHKALFAEDKGLFYIKKLINEAHNHLTERGVLHIEFDSSQKNSIEEHISNTYEYTFQKDQFGYWRTVTITQKNKPN